MSVEIVDLEQLVKDNASAFLDSDQRKHCDTKKPIIDWDRLIVHYGETKYSQHRGPAKPTAHVLFSAVFANNTPKPQTYALRTERVTRSSTTVMFTKTFSYGAEISVKLTPPNPVIEANAGFRAEVSNTKGACETFEQELSWSVDNQIAVPPGFQTKAELVIKEDDFDGNFEVLATFEGAVIVTYENKKTKEHISTIQDTAKNIFHNKEGFKPDNLGRPTFVVKGVCKCRFGIEQNVKLTETPLPPDAKGSNI